MILSSFDRFAKIAHSPFGESKNRNVNGLLFPLLYPQKVFKNRNDDNVVEIKSEWKYTVVSDDPIFNRVYGRIDEIPEHDQKQLLNDFWDGVIKTFYNFDDKGVEAEYNRLIELERESHRFNKSKSKESRDSSSASSGEETNSSEGGSSDSSSSFWEEGTNSSKVGSFDYRNSSFGEEY